MLDTSKLPTLFIIEDKQTLYHYTNTNVDKSSSKPYNVEDQK
jgi:hypothetical protein